MAKALITPNKGHFRGGLPVQVLVRDGDCGYFLYDPWMELPTILVVIVKMIKIRQAEY